MLSAARALLALVEHGARGDVPGHQFGIGVVVAGESTPGIAQNGALAAQGLREEEPRLLHVLQIRRSAAKRPGETIRRSAILLREWSRTNKLRHEPKYWCSFRKRCRTDKKLRDPPWHQNEDPNPQRHLTNWATRRLRVKRPDCR